MLAETNRYELETLNRLVLAHPHSKDDARYFDYPYETKDPGRVVKCFVYIKNIGIGNTQINKIYTLLKKKTGIPIFSVYIILGF